MSGICHRLMREPVCHPGPAPPFVPLSIVNLKAFGRVGWAIRVTIAKISQATLEASVTIEGENARIVRVCMGSGRVGLTSFQGNKSQRTVQQTFINSPRFSTSEVTIHLLTFLQLSIGSFDVNNSNSFHA
jgi:hypothetical protein